LLTLEWPFQSCSN